MKHTTLIISGAIVALILAGGYATSFFMAEPASQANESEPSNEPASNPTVHLSPKKAAIAGIQTSPVRRRSFTATRSIPGRLAYDASKHVALRAPSDGIIESLAVKPGDDVAKDTVVGVLQSPAIGIARSVLMQRMAEYDLAANESDWRSTINANVQKLAEAIRQRDDINVLEDTFRGATLGRYRADLIGKYNTVLLAEKLSSSLGQMQSNGAISGKVVAQRTAELGSARSALNASLEEALYETVRQKQQAIAAVRATEQSVLLAKQELLTLSGRLPQNNVADSGPAESNRENKLSLLQLISPIKGRVQEQFFSASERVSKDDDLLVIADTTQLWVQAELRASDFQSMSIAPGDTVNVVISPESQTILPAKVHFIGAEVSASSGTLPLVAVIDNPDGRLKPGMFVTVAVPTTKVSDALVVPDSAIIDLESNTSVFIQDADDYRVVSVVVGSQSGEMTEVVSGLSEGDRVVTAGAFVLKSELLLEGEE